MPFAYVLQVVVVFNARPEAYVAPYLPGLEHLTLHPALAALADDEGVQGCDADDASKQITVSPRFTAVYVQRR